MTKVFTDQLAALPITEIVIKAIEGGRYTAFLALEGRLLRIYELDNTALCRRSIADIKSVLLEYGCGKRAVLVHHSANDELMVNESALGSAMKLALG
ncbi:DUF6482 family protein [Zhongshania aliphaticivorans]|uniref:DUF6482 family protein n=1 Tax=Zhongshania aliphaticivorans TaxID=1470434 RepID=UPI0012E686C0|nr:DUF6482 family protein [Zhongshania aliphaticivorans]CAA0106647.1 Uncharacterised protein [Zhongshania aliphaticivorans]